ncbi:hypothetical protein SMC6_00650 [Candidatus Cryosericum odellii]|uniref:Uncharacterized protein n=1 Tax=Candidatus Cryosericum odellii TaxID=2290917 RepID=A0A398D8B5_9BACT|nr:hypothetical protein SMC6_00650 [Candidatus Cryosericum odellii]
MRLCLSLAVSIATSTQIASYELHHEEIIVSGEEMVLMLTYTTPSPARSWDMAGYDSQGEKTLLN